MSNLTKDMQAYIGTTNEEKQAFVIYRCTSYYNVNFFTLRSIFSEK